jgi:predicted metal-dependent phosphoesterase TrpH
MAFGAIAQNVNNIQMPELLHQQKRQTINVPNILGYQTLKCDFHMHTVFSDGIVWPTVRVDEAFNEGLDVIAITDHIEKHPSKPHVGGDDNSAFEIALPLAKQKNIILIHGGEITRSMAPGHFNALFITNTNALDTPDFMDAFKAAHEQGAFVIWNHPGWKAQQPDTCKWWDTHTMLYEKGWFHAIEVFNEKEWYPIVLDWCINKNLAVISTSDIHGITSEVYNLNKYHRPMTLVLANDRSEEAVREALFAKRTIAWFGDALAGEEQYLKAFFEAAVTFKLFEESNKGNNYLVKNTSDVPFNLSSASVNFTIPANGETIITIPQNSKNQFEIKNLHTKATEYLMVSIILTK